jgi:hypothetical protein
VNKAVLTVTPVDATRPYGDANPTFTGTITGVVNNDTITATYGTTALQSSAIGSYPITATLADPGNKQGNYSVTLNTGNLTVAARALTVTADAQQKAYGIADPALTYKITSGSLVNSDAFTGAPTRDAGENVGTYAIKQGTLALSSNYSVIYVGANLTISPASLTVKANNASMTYGGTLPAFSAAYSGFVNNDTASVLTGVPSFTPATAPTAAGTYPITLAQGTLTATNYTFTFVNGTLTVNKAVLTVKANEASMTYGGTLPTFSAAYSGFVNNDTQAVLAGAPSFTPATAPGAVGTYPITPAQGTLAAVNYTFAFVNGTLTVSPATLTITPDGNKTKVVGSTFTAFTGTVTGLQYNDTVSVTYSSAGAPSMAAVGTYDIAVATVTFTPGSSASNYTTIKNTASNGLTVLYNACPLYDPTRAVKGGATYPIKLYLCDVNGADVSSPAVVLNATGIYQNSSFTGAVEDAGNSNPDSNFRYDATLGPSGGYIFNLKTSGLHTGSYTLTFSVGGTSSKSYTTGFGVK